MNNLSVYTHILFLLGLVLMFILVLKGNTVNVNKDGVQAIPGRKKKQPPHARCKHVKDVIVVLRDRDDLRAKINKIETFKMPRDIMRIAEHNIKDLKEVLKKNYVSLLEDTGNTCDFQQIPQLKLYKVMLDSFDTATLAECRRMMHENSWVEKERHGEWNNYVTKHVEFLIQSYTAMLDDVYVIESPNREELREHKRDETISYAKDKLRETMNEMLVVSKHWHKEIDNLESQMDFDMEKLFGCFEEGV